MIDLLGTSYLSMHDILEKDNFFKYPESFRITNAVTRNSDFDFSTLQAVEKYLCDMFSCEACCLLSSGFLAGIAINDFLLSLSSGKNQILFEDSTHSCSSTISQHLGVRQKILKNTRAENYSVVLDSVNSLYGFSNYGYLEDELALNADIIAIDCSHTVFLWDAYLQSSLTQPVIYFGSLAKSAAFPAGFIAGPRSVVESITQRTIYGASSPPPQWAAKRLLNSMEELYLRRNKLNEYVRFIDEQLERVVSYKRFPVFRFGNAADIDAIVSDFANNGFSLSRIHYPTASSPEIVRAVLNSSLSWDEIRVITTLLVRHKADIIKVYSRSPSYISYRK